MHRRRLRSALLLGVASGGVLAAGGFVGAGPAGAARLSGQVEAVGSPLAGARVELRAAGPGGSRVLGTARSAADGSFSIRYSAPRSSAGGGARAQLYALATGGRRGGAGGSGAAGDSGGTGGSGSSGGPELGARVRLLSVAGPVGETPAALWIDERSTVAGAYALARFIDLRGRVAGPSPGLPNAVTTAANLFETGAGKVSFVLSNSPNGTATEALPTFNTLANALAACTTGTRADCSRLFAAAQPPGAAGARPADTLAAAVAIAQRPSAPRPELLALARSAARRAGRAAYAPALSRTPGSWILALVYTGGGMNAPGRMAFDAAGNAWIGNNFQTPGTTAGLGLTVLDPAGQPILGSPIRGGGYRGPGWGTAVDGHGRIWNANFAGNSVTLSAPDGRPISPSTGYTAGNPVRPQGLAIGRDGDVWIASFGNDTVIRYRRGNPRDAQVITGGGLQKPFSIAVDARGHAWVTNGAESTRRGTITELLPDGTPSASSPIAARGLRSPQGLALDSQGNVWVADLFERTVVRLGPDGRVAPGSPLRLPSVKGGWGVAVDGADHVWVAGFLGGNVTELCGVRTATCPAGVGTGAPISPSGAGYTSAGFEHMTAVQIDQSGNVWLANNWTFGSPPSEFVGGNGLVQLVGAATPVSTPLLGLPRRP